MNTSTMISVGLGLAWVIAVCMGMASLALAHDVGHRYVFTGAGVSRLGPPIGRRLASIVLTYEGMRTALAYVLPREYPTLLVFLGALDSSADESLIKDTLVPDLRRFVSLSKNALRVRAICPAPCEKLEPRLQMGDYLNVIVLPPDQYDQLTQKLLIRVAPFGVLVDRHKKVLAKGLVNNFLHLCWITTRGGEAHADTAQDDLGHIIRLCDPIIQTALAKANVVEL